jgi:molecular chaperone DnaK (HSP70)
MWPPFARHTMLEALKSISIPIEVAALVSEPQACIALVLSEAVKSMARLGIVLVEGHYVLIVDTGGGTSDLVNFEVKEKPSPHSRLDAVSSKAGSLSAGVKVDERLLRTVEKTNPEIKAAGRLGEFAKTLHMEPVECECHLLEEIERLKKEFPKGGRLYAGNVVSKNHAEIFTFTLLE